MTPGQELALDQLRTIHEANPLALEILDVEKPQGWTDILVLISVSCGGIKCQPEGLPLRERERFIIQIPPRFPFDKPDVWTPHKRFAGRPHVQWGHSLCLYQASLTEWDYADGMFGFVHRLEVWLEHGARNEPDPEGYPIHPPVAYVGESDFAIVPKADCPPVAAVPWFGLARLEPINKRSFAITSWHSVTDAAELPAPVAPAILLPTNLPWEMPKQMAELSFELEKSGVSKQQLVALLQWVMLINPKDHPLFFIVGSPQRGVQAVGQLKQHLMVWQVMDLMLKALNLSTDTWRSLFQLGDVAQPHQIEHQERLRAIQAEAERIALESFGLVKVNWCSVYEDRPEVTKRRDDRSPMTAFRDRHVCLWGCGALGSHVGYLLVKAGAKKLTLIDKAAVKPGLLVRQQFSSQEIGEAKATALKRRLDSLGSACEIEALIQNVHVDFEPGQSWTRGSDVVVDCTASDTVHAKTETAWMDESQKRVPIISMIVGHRAERGIVVTVLPKHTGGFKDVYRKAKIEACRKPYLSAFVEDFYPTGENIEFFQPEPGCSDATFEGSCADVVGLSAMMLNAAATSLHRESPSKATVCFMTQPHLSTAPDSRAFARFEFEADIVCQANYQVRVAPQAWREITSAIRESRRKRGLEPETGGLLFGKRDDALRVIWIDDAMGPPPDSVCRSDKFICGVRGTQEANTWRKKQTRGATEFVGMWHTHPQDIPLPSETDVSGMAQILTSGERPPNRSLLFIVGWEKGEMLLGSSVFDRKTFLEHGLVHVGIAHFPELKI